MKKVIFTILVALMLIAGSFQSSSANINIHNAHQIVSNLTSVSSTQANGYTYVVYHIGIFKVTLTYDEGGELVNVSIEVDD